MPSLSTWSSDAARVCEGIGEVDTEQCSEDIRILMCQGLRHAIPEGGKERHAYQEQFAASIRDTLVEAQLRAATAAEAVGPDSEATRDAQGALVTCTAARDEALKMENAARAELEEKEAAVAVARKARDEEETQHKAAEVVAQKASAALGLQTDKLSTCEAVTNGSLRMLVEGGWGEGDDEMKDSVVAAVLEFATSVLCAEPCLLAALPGALGLRPEQRGAFDQVTLAGLDEVLQEYAAALRVEIAQATPCDDDMKAELLGAWAVMDMAKEQLHDAQGTVADAKSSLKTCVGAREVADATVKSAGSLVSARLGEQALADSKLVRCNEVLEALDRMLAGEWPADAPAEEDVAMEEPTVVAVVEESTAPTAGDSALENAEVSTETAKLVDTPLVIAAAALGC